ncbi:MAG: rhomboid family intramembrane serine protease [Planctomycetota bacterium]
MFPDKKESPYWDSTGNHIVMILMTVIFAIQFTCDPQAQYLNGLILKHLVSLSLFMYLWLHVDFVHIVSNLILLWIFGRYVCSKVGNAGYFLAYLATGIAAGTVHCIYDGRPVIGASGAIMGILGIYVVLCFKRFGPAGPWLILVWFLMSLAASFTGTAGISYLAHVGGFCAGIIIAAILVFFNIAETDETGQSLLNLLSPLSIYIPSGKAKRFTKLPEL